MAKKKYDNARKQQRTTTKQRTRRSGRYHDNEFDTLLQQYGLKIRSIASDGNCMFSSIADQLYGDTSRHMDIRTETTDYMLQQQDEFKMFCEFGEEGYLSYVKKMSRTGVWGDYTCLNAICRVYNVNVVIWQIDLPRMEIHNTIQNQHTRTLHISYHNESHYASVRNIGDNLDSMPTPINVNNKRMVTNHNNNTIDNTQLNDAELTVQQQTGCTNIDLIRNTLNDCNNDMDAAVQVLIAEQNATPDIDTTMSQCTELPPVEPGVLHITFEANAFGTVDINMSSYGVRIQSEPMATTSATNNKAHSITAKPRKRDKKQLKKQEKALKRKHKQRIDTELHIDNTNDSTTDIVDKLGSITI